MDETTGSLTDWFSSTVKSVGTQVANSWADAWSRRQEALAPPAQSPYTATANKTGAGKAADLVKNPLAWLLLGLGLFAAVRLARG